MACSQAESSARFRQSPRFPCGCAELLFMMHGSAYLDQIRNALADSWLPQVYSERVLKSRTRAYQFPNVPRNAKVDIHHTLLGIELQAGRMRMLCPDLASARYLSVFARIGCDSVAIPYDITRISLVADELESSWHRMLLVSDEISSGLSNAFRARIRRLIIGKVRDEIAAAGAGPPVPQFRQTTKQRTEPQESTKGTKRNAAP